MRKYHTFIACAFIFLSPSCNAESLVFSGRLAPNPLAIFSTSAEGVLEVSVKANSVVQAGQTVGFINAPQLEDALHQLQSEAQQLTTELEGLEHWEDSYEVKLALHAYKNATLSTESICHRYDSSHQLYKHGLISGDEFEADQRQCQLAKESEQLSLEHLKAVQERGSDKAIQAVKSKASHVQARLSAKERALSSLTLVSPVEGILLSNADSKGLMWVQNRHLQAGEAIAMIADKESVLVKITADEFDVVRLKCAMPAQLQLTAYPGLQALGQIVDIDALPKEEGQRSPQYQVTLSFRPEDLNTVDWRWGFSATVTIEA